jgi:predicted dehydrogenase
MKRIGLIGFGGYGWQLAQQIFRHGEDLGCRLVAAADGRLDALDEPVRQLRERDVALYDDALAMLDDRQGRCDIVMIATGIATHRPLLERVAGGGFAIHLEKPPAAAVQDVDAMIDAVDRAGVPCLVGFQQIHDDSLQEFHRYLSAGKLGTIRSATCVACWPRPRSYYDRNDWAGRLGGPDGWVLDGPASNALSHQINNLLFLLGPQEGSYARPASVRGELYVAGPLESHNTAAIEMHLPDGLAVQYLLSHAVREQSGPVIEIVGDRGRARWPIRNALEVEYADGRTESVESTGRERTAMIANLLHAVETGRAEDLRCDLRQARQMVLTLDTAHESSGCIHRIDDRYCTLHERDDAPTLVHVDGLEAILQRCAEQRSLPSDLSDKPEWAVATEPFTTDGYDRFPQRFGAG